jgi:hypothetical protein
MLWTKITPKKWGVKTQNDMFGLVLEICDMSPLGPHLLTRKIIKKSDCCLLGRGAMSVASFFAKNHLTSLAVDLAVFTKMRHMA